MFGNISLWKLVSRTCSEMLPMAVSSLIVTTVRLPTLAVYAADNASWQVRVPARYASDGSFDGGGAGVLSRTRR